MPTMTEAQAAQQAERYIAELVAALPVKPRLELFDASTGNCLDPTDRGSEDRVEVSRTYWLRDLPPERRPEYFDAAIRYWTSHGFRIISDSKSTFRGMNVENERDGFLMEMETAAPSGAISVGATSPCIWPQGTPTPPTTRQ